MIANCHGELSANACTASLAASASKMRGALRARSAAALRDLTVPSLLH
jgi:hypothetical protein